jgi:hypothetical protein
MGSRRVSNYWWATVRGLGVFINGLSSYLQFDLLPVIHSQNIVFSTRPCYVFMDFLGLLFSFYLGLTILWSVGEGFNEFDKQQGIVRIFVGVFQEIIDELTLVIQ